MNATNGATVNEILGNGDGTQMAFQRFTLKQSPLTYTTAATSTGGQSSLQIWVNGEEWTEVPWFFGHGPAEHIFTTTRNDDATTTTAGRLPDGLTGLRQLAAKRNSNSTDRHRAARPRG